MRGTDSGHNSTPSLLTHICDVQEVFLFVLSVTLSEELHKTHTHARREGGREGTEEKVLLTMMVEYTEPHTYLVITQGSVLNVISNCLPSTPISMYSKCLYHEMNNNTCTCTCSIVTMYRAIYKLVLNCEAGLAVFPQHP